MAKILMASQKTRKFYLLTVFGKKKYHQANSNGPPFLFKKHDGIYKTLTESCPSEVSKHCRVWRRFVQKVNWIWCKIFHTTIWKSVEHFIYIPPSVWAYQELSAKAQFKLSLWMLRSVLWLFSSLFFHWILVPFIGTDVVWHPVW